ARDRARDLGAFERVREPVPVVVALVVDEDLGLVLEAAERSRVHDAVAVALEGGAVGMGLLGEEATARRAALHRVGGEAFGLLALEDLPGAHEAHRAARGGPPPAKAASEPGMVASERVTDAVHARSPGRGRGRTRGAAAGYGSTRGVSNRGPRILADPRRFPAVRVSWPRCPCPPGSS